MSKAYKEMREWENEQILKSMKTQPIKYQRECKGILFDVYDILKAFDVKNPAIAHAVKKLLTGGKRGYKDIEQDYEEAIASIKRGIELER